MKNNSKEGSDDFDKITRAGDKITEIGASIGISIAATSMVSLLTGIIDSPYNLAFLTGGSLLISPLMYFGLYKLKSKMDDRMNRDMHHASQLCVMLKEAAEHDRRIKNMTSFFLPEILDVFEQNNKGFPQDELMKINQFIYLVNCNYYTKISTKTPSLTREQLIKNIISEVSRYLNETGRTAFDETDVPKILNRCFYISEDIQKEISAEFKKSKVNFFKDTFYEIVRNDIEGDISKYMAKKDEETKGLHLEFDIDDINCYRHLIDAFRDNHIFDEMGDMSRLDWDYEFLRTTIKTIITSQRTKLLTEIDDYSDFWLTSDFIFNAITYALVNNRSEVGQKEILSTFKNWDYLPFNIMLDGVNVLFESEHLDYSKHPFKVSKPKGKRPYQKIIPFPKNSQETN